MSGHRRSPAAMLGRGGARAGAASTALVIDPDQVRERRVAQRAAALQLALAGSRRRRGGRRRRSTARPARWSGRARGRRAGRGRPGPRAGRSARTCAPRRGSRGSAGSRRRRARRRASRPGSRGPWRPSGCRAAGPSGAAAKRASSSGTASLLAAVSASSRKTGMSSARRSSASTRSVPAPWRATESEPQASQRVGIRSRWPQWWQAERVLGAVQDERDVAVRALPRLPARAAGEEVRPAAAVEQHDRLARGAERPPRLGMQRVLRAAHVEHPHRRQVAAARDARRQPQPAQSVHGLRARRRRAGQQPRAGLVGAVGGDVAGVVARVALLLVGGVVLLVDHDQPEVARPARRPPSAGRRRSAPRPSAAAATRRSARPRRARSAAARRCRRSARRSAPRSAASARSPARARSRPPRAPAPPPPRAGRPRSCPSR